MWEEAEKEDLLFLKELNKLQDISSYKFDSIKEKYSREKGKNISKKANYIWVEAMSKYGVYGFKVFSTDGRTMFEVAIANYKDVMVVNADSYLILEKIFLNYSQEELVSIAKLVTRYYFITELLRFEKTDINKYLSSGLDFLYIKNIETLGPYFTELLKAADTKNFFLKEQTEHSFLLIDLAVPDCLEAFLASPQFR